MKFMREVFGRFSDSLFPSLKKSVVRLRAIFLWLGIGVFFLLLVEPSAEPVPGAVYFLGRFHPLVIHFPVALVMLALLFELCRRFGLLKIPDAIVGFTLALALVGSLISLALGLMLYYTGEYAGGIMQQHLWGAVSFTACLSFSVYFFIANYKSPSRPVYGFYFVFLVCANITLGYTSHQGGSLTHGSGYLTEYMPSLTRQEDKWQPKRVEEMRVFQDVITPILKRKCMSCHNENKAKGDLIMTSYDALRKGGKSEEPVLIPGSFAESSVYRRVTLPLKHDDRMPPEGKVGLTDAEVALLAWWIDQGADTLLHVTAASADSAIRPLMQTYLAELEMVQRATYLRQQSTEKLIKTVSRDNYMLGADPYDPNGITLTMVFPPVVFGDNDLLHIQPIFSRITKASFIGSDITDDGLYHVGQMTSLRELYLQQTAIKGAGIVHLSKLKELILLDLSKSSISNGQLLNILYLPSLQDVYVNETPISDEIINALKENKPELKVHTERGTLF